ncbi:Smr/MutS family protein [Kaarinaea lacus]
MSKKNSPRNDDDTELFQQMMEGVTPLAQNKIDPDSAPKTSKPRHYLKEPKQLSQFGELDYAPAVAADEQLLFARNGVQQKILSKLKKGQFPIERKIDLHGSTIDEAGKKLQHTINTALANQYRCVLVVHGRGKGSFDNKPAIKTHVNQWLRSCNDVLAFCSAQPYHGGTGAVYVLLRRQREK